MNLTKENWIKLGKGLVIAMLGAAAVYISEFASGADFGIWTPIIVAGASVFVNFVRKLADQLRNPVEG